MSYDAAFFAEQELAGRSAEIVLPLLFEWLRPSSLVDVGCGIGSWASVALDLGIPEETGVDGDYVDLRRMQIPEASFVAADLEHPLDLGRRFDLAICLEVGEHLSPVRADGLVGDLCALSDVVMFSAAIPGQGGVRHVNEQWPSYWISRFGGHGFVAFDAIRPRVWHDERVAFIYRQNCFLAANERVAPALRGHASSVVLDCVHPVAWTGTRSPGIRTSLRHLQAAVVRGAQGN